jgi:hypothetical protein
VGLQLDIFNDRGEDAGFFFNFDAPTTVGAHVFQHSRVRRGRGGGGR